MSPDRAARGRVPEPVRKILDEFRRSFGLSVRLWSRMPGERFRCVYPPGQGPPQPSQDSMLRTATSRVGLELVLEVSPPGPDSLGGSLDATAARAAADVLSSSVAQLWESDREIRLVTDDLSKRYEEINLLYSISETLGSILQLDESARCILGEICEVMGAVRGSVWVHEAADERLHRVASVGEMEEGGDPSPPPLMVRVFQDGRPRLQPGTASSGEGSEEEETALSVPIRYTPPSEEPRTVGVINLRGRRGPDSYNLSDQKLLLAIASQVGAAVENSRLVRESISKERMSREMELAHNLQMKLLSSVAGFDAARVAARVTPAESVGGDFYHLIRLVGEQVGVMIGDVSSHGFPAALIMALSMSAATIYAAEVSTPELVLRHLDDALRDELERTEMYLTLFYGVLNPEENELLYSNAGHPHAFLIHGDGSHSRLHATDPPVGIAGPGSFGQERVSFESGRDLLLLFTDGLSDTLARTDRISGERAVVEEVARRRHQTPGEIVEALFEMAEETVPRIPSDDRTAIILGA